MGQEQIGAIVLAAGIVCLMIAAVWAFVVAFRTFWQRRSAPFFSSFLHRIKRPAWLALIGAVFIGGTFAWNAVAQRIDLGPRDKIVDGERHITLTGWDQHDYSVLRDKPDVVVLQMANPEVTDETLEFVRGKQQLKEIDLNDTQITDKSLAILKELPALSSARLRGTKITDAGFQNELGSKDSLMNLDLRETAVSSKTVRNWKKAREGRNALK